MLRHERLPWRGSRIQRAVVELATWVAVYFVVVAVGVAVVTRWRVIDFGLRTSSLWIIATVVPAEIARVISPLATASFIVAATVPVALLAVVLEA